LPTTTIGQGKALLLVHGIGSSSATWRAIAPELAQDRRVIALDLPGHGRTPAEADSGTFAGLVRSVEEFLVSERLAGVDMVGSSLGGRLVLELARRGRAGAVVALDPGGFWFGWERTYLQTSLLASVYMLRVLGGLRGAVACNPASRSMVLAQLSAHPWKLDGEMVAAELDSYARTKTFTELVNHLAAAPMQDGPAARGTGSITIGWGRHDRLCRPVQAGRALAAFPSARLHWFEHSGHFPLWDEPEETVALIRATIGG
jgi:pimeloyl-ACP methyl ester carboxylesterase